MIVSLRTNARVPTQNVRASLVLGDGQSRGDPIFGMEKTKAINFAPTDQVGALNPRQNHAGCLDCMGHTSPDHPHLDQTDSLPVTEGSRVQTSNPNRTTARFLRFCNDGRGTPNPNRALHPRPCCRSPDSPATTRARPICSAAFRRRDRRLAATLARRNSSTRDATDHGRPVVATRRAFA